MEPLKMSGGARATEIIGLIDVIHRLNAPLDTSHLAYECHADIPTVQTMMETAKMLGLITVENGNVTLTSLGLEFHKTSQEKMRLLGARLAEIEPFKTALEFVSRERALSAHELAEALNRKGLQWNHEEEENEGTVTRLLIDWAVYAGLLSYSGKTERFRKAPHRYSSNQMDRTWTTAC